MALRLTPLALLAVVWFAGCDALRIDGDTTLVGTVVDAASGDPVVGARVSAGEATDSTDADGRFELVVFADSTGQDIVVEAAASGYRDTSVLADADVGEMVELGVVALTRLGAGGSDGGDGATGTSGPAESLSLDGRSAEAIGVTGAGGIETASLTFVAYDGEGRPVDATNAVDLAFEIVQGPGGGETIRPTEATTGADGSVQVTVTSGTRSGTVQVQASGTVDGETIRSLPVTVTITGGLPDDAHFSVTSEQFNFAGYNRFGLTNAVTAFVGDRYGNPVQTGTAVYFTTDGGIIPGSGVTSAIGTTSVNLLSADPRPAGSFECGGTVRTSEGYGRVTASTSGEDGVRIEDSATILFSGLTRIDVVDPTAQVQLRSYTYRVQDQFGNPLAPGTSVTVVAEGENVEATGDTDVTLGDYRCPGTSRTEFSFSIVEGDGDEPADPETVTITVTSPNGNVSCTLPGCTGASARRRAL